MSRASAPSPRSSAPPVPRGRVRLHEVAVTPSSRARIASQVLRWLCRGWRRDLSDPAAIGRIRRRVVLVDRATAWMGISRTERFDWSRGAVNDVRVRRIRPRVGGANLPRSALLYLHGGAFAFRALNGHMNLAAAIARRSGLAQAVLPIYRLAPEHPFPAGMDDCLSVYRGLLQEGVPADRICLAGDSAGGGLVLKLMMRLRAEGGPMPACAVLLSPFTDLSFSGESVIRNAPVDPMFGDIPVLHARFYHGQMPAQDPRCSPVFGDFSRLPPMLVQVGSTERLLDDSLRLLPRVERGGGELQVEVWNQMPHVWHVMGLPESHQAIASIGRFVRAKLFRSMRSPPDGEGRRRHEDALVPRLPFGRRLVRNRRPVPLKAPAIAKP